MSGKSNIELRVNGTRVYTRRVGAHRRYTHAAVPSAHATSIVSCSSTGKFSAYLNGCDIHPVVWVDDSTAVVSVSADAAELARWIAVLDARIAELSAKSEGGRYYARHLRDLNRDREMVVGLAVRLSRL